MANDITLNAGAGGAIIATDITTSSEHHQRVKIVYGDTGTFNMVSTSLPFPVQVPSAIGVATSTSGGITSNVRSLSSGTVTLSSAPGFNIPIVSASSGLVQVSGNVGLSSGIVTLSSVHTVTATAATNPWSSAPSFNVPIVSASSGLVQISGTATIVSASSGLVQISGTPSIVSASSGVVQLAQVTSSGQSMFLVFTTGGVTVSNITTAASNLKGYMLFNSSATPYAVKVYNSTNPTAGSTTAMVLTLLSPGSTGGAGANMAFMHPGPYSSNGWSIIPTGNLNATSTSAAPADMAINLTYQT